MLRDTQKYDIFTAIKEVYKPVGFHIYTRHSFRKSIVNIKGVDLVLMKKTLFFVWLKPRQQKKVNL